MSKRSGVGRVFTRAATGPLNLSVLGGGVIGAIALASWPIAALGVVAYAALVASDVSSAAFRRRVLFGRTRPLELPEIKHIADPEVRAAVQRIAIARDSVAKMLRDLPERIQRNVTTARASIDELLGHGSQLATRADELSRHLAGTDPRTVEHEAKALIARAAHTGDPKARASYEAAAKAAEERVVALRDIVTVRERTLAHLAEIESAIKSVPTKLVHLRALDDQATDAMTGDLDIELDRMNSDLRAFEQTLASIVETQT